VHWASQKAVQYGSSPAAGDKVVPPTVHWRKGCPVKERLHDEIPAHFVLMQDVAKQLITLSTAIVVVSGVFLRDLMSDQAVTHREFLYGAWIACVLCIITAAAVLNTIAAYWGQRLREESGETILSPMIGVFGRSSSGFQRIFWVLWLRLFLVLQWYSFVAAVVLFFVFVWLNID
jgi:hypothetical protein